MDIIAHVTMIEGDRIRSAECDQVGSSSNMKKQHRPVTDVTLLIAMANNTSDEVRSNNAKSAIDDIRVKFLAVLKQNDTNIKASAYELGYDARTFYRHISNLCLWPEIEKIRANDRLSKLQTTIDQVNA